MKPIKEWLRRRKASAVPVRKRTTVIRPRKQYEVLCDRSI